MSDDVNKDAVQAVQIEVLNTPSTKQLFYGFMKLGLMGFGGVLPLAHRLLVEDQKWLSTEQFTNLLGICQVLPGGNIINMAAALGMQFQGIKGAFSAVCGLIFAPTIIVVAMFQLYSHFQDIPVIKHMIEGLAAAAAGLLFATGFKMLKPIIRNKLILPSLVLSMVFMLWLKLPLALTLIILISINLAILSLKKGAVKP